MTRTLVPDQPVTPEKPSDPADTGSVISLPDDVRMAIARSREAAQRGEFATEAEVQAVWTKHGL